MTITVDKKLPYSFNRCKESHINYNAQPSEELVKGDTVQTVQSMRRCKGGVECIGSLTNRQRKSTNDA